MSAALKEIDPESPLTLAVGWRSGKKIQVRQIRMSVDVASAFRAVVRNTLSDLSRREAEAWAPDADISPETYLVLDAEDVGDSPALTTDHSGKSFLDVLLTADQLEEIDPKKLPTRDLVFYAIVIGAPTKKSAFIRRSNPRRGLKRGRIYSALADTLHRIEEPIFAFDEWVDLVVVGDRIYVLSQTVFAAFFRDQETLAARIPEWIGVLTESVPITDEGRERLEERIKRDSRLKARLEAIVRRGHLTQISSEALKTAMGENGLSADKFLDPDGRLRLETSDIPDVLYLLNEDLFTGPLSNTGFRADKKAQR